MVSFPVPLVPFCLGCIQDLEGLLRSKQPRLKRTFDRSILFLLLATEHLTVRMYYSLINLLLMGNQSLSSIKIVLGGNSCMCFFACVRKYFWRIHIRSRKTGSKLVHTVLPNYPSKQLHQVVIPVRMYENIHFSTLSPILDIISLLWGEGQIWESYIFTSF